MIGTHLGRQFFESSPLYLRGEFGPVYVREQFDAAENNDYLGALFEFEAESDILGFGTTLFLFHDTTLNLQAYDEPLSNTTIGLRLPLIFRFETSLLAEFRHNGGAPEGIEAIDETYTFRIGYSW